MVSRIDRWLVAGAASGLCFASCAAPTRAPRAPPAPTEVAATLAAPSMVPPLVSLESEPPVLAPDFTLTDQGGHPLALSRLRGAPVLLTFLYSNCTDTCPLYTARIRTALDEVDPSNRIRVVAVTVDPERDTVERLGQYTRDMGWGPGWYFVTGTPEQAKAARDAYRISAIKEDVSPEMAAMGHEDYEIAHRAALFLIDANGVVVGVLRGTEWSPDDLAAKVRPLVPAPPTEGG